MTENKCQAIHGVLQERRLRTAIYKLHYVIYTEAQIEDRIEENQEIISRKHVRY